MNIYNKSGYNIDKYRLDVYYTQDAIVKKNIQKMYLKIHLWYGILV